MTGNLCTNQTRGAHSTRDRLLKSPPRIDQWGSNAAVDGEGETKEVHVLLSLQTCYCSPPHVTHCSIRPTRESLQVWPKDRTETHHPPASGSALNEMILDHCQIIRRFRCCVMVEMPFIHSWFGSVGLVAIAVKVLISISSHLLHLFSSIIALICSVDRLESGSSC